MRVAQSYVTPPTAEPLRTRRPASGITAASVLEPVVYLQMERHRPCVTHSVDTAIIGDWQTTAIPASAGDPIRVVIPLSDRAEYVGVALQYRADPSAVIQCTLVTMAGVVRDTIAWQAPGAGASVTLPVTRSRRGAFGAPYEWSYSVVSTGDQPRSAALTTPRPLVVPAADAGTVMQVALSCASSQVLSVALYELTADEVTP